MIDKLKVLSESLTNSAAKSQKRISDTRSQHEEALKFRASKESEVSELEKEEELTRSIVSCKAESDVIKTWINFLQDPWAIQCSYVESKEKHAKDELNVHEDFFVDLAFKLLSRYKKELEPCIETYVKNLKALSGRNTSEVKAGNNEDATLSNPKRILEEEYLAKIVTTFSVVDNMKEHMFSKQGKMSRKDDSKVKELIDDIEKLRAEFDSIERPTLEIEARSKEIETPASEKLQEIFSPALTKSIKTSKTDKGPTETSGAREEQVLDYEAEIAKLESEFGSMSLDYASEEISGWEFDELEKELADELQKGT